MSPTILASTRDRSCSASIRAPSNLPWRRRRPSSSRSVRRWGPLRPPWKSAQARVVKETAELENVHAQTERVFELVKRGVYPAAKADTARATQDAARAVLTASQADLAKAREELGPKGADNPQLKEALATLGRARLNLLYTTVKAPAAGVVSNLQLATGQFIGAGQAALTFIDTEHGLGFGGL